MGRRTDFPVRYDICDWFGDAPQWGGVFYSDEMRTIRRKRSGIPYNLLDTIKGTYKDCDYLCSYEKIEIYGEEKMYVECGIGFQEPRNAPIIAKKDLNEELENAIDRYEHKKYIPVQLWQYHPDRPNEYTVLSEIEFFSDLDPDKSQTEEEIKEFIRKEFEEAVDFYESVTKSLGKRKAFGERL